MWSKVTYRSKRQYRLGSQAKEQRTRSRSMRNQTFVTWEGGKLFQAEDLREMGAEWSLPSERGWMGIFRQRQITTFILRYVMQAEEFKQKNNITWFQHLKSVYSLCGPEGARATWETIALGWMEVGRAWIRVLLWGAKKWINSGYEVVWQD